MEDFKIKRFRRISKSKWRCYASISNNHSEQTKINIIVIRRGIFAMFQIPVQLTEEGLSNVRKIMSGILSMKWKRYMFAKQML